jgi:hypothetical protein
MRQIYILGASILSAIATRQKTVQPVIGSPMIVNDPSGPRPLGIERSPITGESVVPITIGSKKVWVSLDLGKSVSEFQFDCSTFVQCMERGDSVSGPKNSLTTVVDFGVSGKETSLPFTESGPRIDTAGSLALSPHSAISREFKLKFGLNMFGEFTLELEKPTERSRIVPSETPTAWEVVLDLPVMKNIVVTIDMSDDIVVPSRSFVQEISGLTLKRDEQRFYHDCDRLNGVQLVFSHESTQIPVALSRARHGDEITNGQRALCPTNIVLEESTLANVRLGIRAIMPTHDVSLHGDGRVSLIPRQSVVQKQHLRKGMVAQGDFKIVPLFRLDQNSFVDGKLKISFIPVDHSTRASQSFALVSYYKSGKITELVLQRLAPADSVPTNIFDFVSDLKLRIARDGISISTAWAAETKNRVLVNWTPDSVKITVSDA